MFSFHHWFLLSFLGVFIADCVCSLHHCFFRCFFFCFFFHHWFYFCFLSVFISPSFFTVTVFCQVLRFCVVVPRMLRIWESFFYSQAFFTLHCVPKFGTTCFYQGFPGAGNSAFKVAGPSTDVRNTDRVQLFVWVTLFSKRYLSLGSIYVLRSCGTLYNHLPGFEPTL